MVSRRLLFGAAILALGVAVGASVTWVRGSVKADSVERAAILPCSSCQVEANTATGAGYDMTASGITDYWLTARQGTIGFVVFVDPGRPVTQDITFALWPPGGGDQPLVEYTFRHVSIPVEGQWFQIPAQANYSQPGVYTAAVYAGDQDIGYIPLVLANSPNDLGRPSGHVAPPPSLGSRGHGHDGGSGKDQGSGGDSGQGQDG